MERLQVDLLEQILSRENMLQAWKRVNTNKGSAGMDGVILSDGIREPTPCGVPQGGSLSPLPANVMLDDLDKELERRGLRFARYADDFLIFVRSRSAAQRMLHTVGRFIKKRIREITHRSNGQSMRQRIPILRRYVTGWLNYFGHSHSYSQLLELDQWLRRRVRLCYWKQWKRPRPRRRRLLALGISKDEVKLATRSRKGYWQMSHNSIVQRALTNQWLWDQGVPNMRLQWVDLHYPEPSRSG